MQIARPDPPLDDGIVTLEPLARIHLEDMETLGRDPEVGRHTYLFAGFDEDAAVTWLARYITGWRDGSCAGFAVTDKATGEFVGLCSLVRIDQEGEQAEIGYITTANARGRGIAVRAVRLIVEWSFSTLGMKRLELRIAEDNPASKKVAEKAGFQWEGLLRSNYFKQGLREDLNIYSRLP